MELTADEQTLLIVGVAYLVALTVWALSLRARARTMLRRLGKLVEPSLWESLGSPDSIEAAMRDPGRRWYRFVRSGEYRRRLDEEAIGLIDDYRRRTRAMLLVLAGGGLLLLVRFWPILKPDFL